MVNKSDDIIDWRHSKVEEMLTWHFEAFLFFSIYIFCFVWQLDLIWYLTLLHAVLLLHIRNFDSHCHICTSLLLLFANCIRHQATTDSLRLWTRRACGLCVRFDRHSTSSADHQVSRSLVHRAGLENETCGVAFRIYSLQGIYAGEETEKRKAWKLAAFIISFLF